MKKEHKRQSADREPQEKKIRKVQKHVQKMPKKMNYNSYFEDED